MRIPSAVFGTGSEASKKTKPIARHFTRHGQWPETIVSQMSETTETVLEYPFAKIMFHSEILARGERHFRVYAITDSLTSLDYFQFDGPDFPGRINLLFDSLVDSPWGILALLSKSCILPQFQIDTQRKIIFFSRLLEFWELFLDEKEMFEVPGYHQAHGLAFWNTSFTKLFPAMISSGVPRELFESRGAGIFKADEIKNWIEEYILERQ